MKDLPEKVYLTRIEAAEFIELHGLPCSPRTLTKLACVGGGPRYLRFGRMAVYKEEALEEWISEKMKTPEEYVLERVMRGRKNKTRKLGG